MIGGHPSWETLLDFIDKIGSKHGGIIHDNRCGKTWDPGQAICAELYGENWETSEKFNEDNQIPVDQPCPTGALEAAQRVLNGTPWMEEGK